MFFEVKNVSKRYANEIVLDQVTFEVTTGELVSIIGPSGVGKTTLLSIIAGLEQADTGRILFSAPPSKENPVILVFQDYTLFPHMTVFENIAFGLRARRRRKTVIREKVTGLLDYFQLGAKRDSYPIELSAGQKQRVAIARAMVVEPAVLLLDEPFANLDRNLKMDTALFIRETQKEFGITTVCVTHDLEEAFAMSDRIGIMLNGRLEQFAAVDEVYHNPKNIEVARFLGPVNQIPEKLFDRLGIREPDADGRQTVFARPEAVDIEKDDHGPAQVADVLFVGHYIVYHVEFDDVRFTAYSLSDGIAPGDRVRIKLLRYLTS